MSSRSKLVVLTSSTCLVVLLLLGTVMAQSATGDDPYRHLSVFSEVLSRIKSEYVEEPDMKSVTLGATNGMLEALDPYASYLNADQYRQYQKQHSTRRASIGAVLAKKYGSVNVVDVIPGSSAAKANLNTFDMIESINGVATRDMPLAYAELLLSGEPGTTVEVAVLRVTKQEPQKLKLLRAAIKTPPPTSRMIDEQTGYLKVETLEPGKTKECAALLKKLADQGAKKLVLDLRNNAYGMPEEGISLAGLFLENGLIGYLQGQKQTRRDFTAAPANAIWTQPVAVIVNRGSSSGAELVAGALLDSKRAEVIGEKTYGNAALRKPIALEDGGAIILSIAKYYSPSGKALQDTGVVPSIPMTEIELTVDVDEDGNPVNDESKQQPKPVEDTLLKKALEVLNSGSKPADKTPAASAEMKSPEKR